MLSRLLSAHPRLARLNGLLQRVKQRGSGQVFSGVHLKFAAPAKSPVEDLVRNHAVEAEESSPEFLQRRLERSLTKNLPVGAANPPEMASREINCRLNSEIGIPNKGNAPQDGSELRPSPCFLLVEACRKVFPTHRALIRSCEGPPRKFKRAIIGRAIVTT